MQLNGLKFTNLKANSNLGMVEYFEVVLGDKVVCSVYKSSSAVGVEANVYVDKINHSPIAKKKIAEVRRQFISSTKGVLSPESEYYKFVNGGFIGHIQLLAELAYLFVSYHYLKMVGLKKVQLVSQGKALVIYHYGQLKFLAAENGASASGLDYVDLTKTEPQAVLDHYTNVAVSQGANILGLAIIDDSMTTLFDTATVEDFLQFYL